MDFTLFFCFCLASSLVVAPFLKELFRARFPGSLALTSSAVHAAAYQMAGSNRIGAKHTEQQRSYFLLFVRNNF